MVGIGVAALGVCGQGGERKQSQNIAEVITEMRTHRAKSTTCSFRHRPPPPCARETVLASRMSYCHVYGQSLATIWHQHRCASEVQSSDQGPTLDDLSPAQAQRLLEADLRQYREADEAHATSSGAEVTAPSLLNSSPVPGPTSSGKRAHHTGIIGRFACIR